MVRQVLREILDLRAIQVHLGFQGQWDNEVILAFLVHPAHEVIRGHLETRVTQEILDLLDPLGLADPRDLQAIQDQGVLPDCQVLQEFLGHQVVRVLLVLLDL